VGGTRVLIFVEHFLECVAAVQRSEYAALFVWSIRMTSNSYEHIIGMARVDSDLRNLLPVAQSKMRPCLTRVRRFVNTVADRQVRSLQPFPTANVDDTRI